MIKLFSELEEGDRIIFEWEVPEDYPRDKSRCDDIAEAYCITEDKKAASGIVIWAKYRGEWSCNPTSVRPLVKYLLEGLESAIADQQSQLRG